MTSSVPVVPTAAVGQLISASWWNNSGAPPISWILDPDKCDVYDGSGVACGNGTATLLTYDTESSDTQGMHSTSSNLGRVTYFAPGRYALKIFVCMPAATYTQYDVNVRKNSAGSAAGGTSLRTFFYGAPGGSPRQFVAEMDYVFGAGEYTEVFVTQTSGASRTTSVAGLYSTGFQARWVTVS